MKHYQVILLPSAERDIGEAYDWLAEQDEAAAIRWYNRLREVIFSLDAFPERCPLAPERKSFNQEIRQIFHGRRRHKYRILFTVTEGTVHVLSSDGGISAVAERHRSLVTPFLLGATPDLMAPSRA